MKKLPLVLLVLLAAFLAYAAFVPRTIRKDVTAPYYMDVAGRALNRPDMIAKWYVPFNTLDAQQIKRNAYPPALVAGDRSVTLLATTSISGILLAKDGKDSAEFLFTARHDTVDINSIISLVYKTTLFRQLTGGSKLEKDALKSLDNLGAVLNDVKLFYGYPLQKIEVEDTSFLTARKTVGPGELQKGKKELFDMLLKAAQDRNAGYNGVRIFHPSKQQDGSWSLFAGVGVTKHFDTPEKEPIQYRMMPYKKLLLVCDYEGPYYKVEEINTAMKRYLDDHQMVNLAIPFEKIMQDSHDFGDSANVKLRITYPFH
jgi:hypothetical protein